mmetsp:Transcript_11194/g.12833  ORF Transcript_11194/g.12833 Transcript_11194/m.12833 type:complete len:263 (+) Transcript_11194:232-1020(+)|eukprot:CAMPEP_0184006360 /NCGR_PEP_ID=MMETSP0954-20121128/636_1 /TAXON_ID=627963 /ORGANISM="Aplanochytrium sp, Strain PBS07" /LENGTH=262 /DNA_ID=CAMNT_0026284873 /DNA_START=192 /DNA_END=980 /DNA_ORIENTATION=+
MDQEDEEREFSDSGEASDAEASIEQENDETGSEEAESEDEGIEDKGEGEAEASTYNDGADIVLSDDDVEFISQALERLGRWEDVKHSGLWLSFFSLLYFLTEISRYSLVTVVAYVLILQIGSLNILIRNEGVIKGAGIWSEDFDARWLATQRQTMSFAQIDKVTRGAAMVGQTWAGKWEEVLETEDEYRVYGVMAFLCAFTLVGKILPLSAVFFLLGSYIFFFPLVYAKYHDDIDQAYANTHERLMRLREQAAAAMQANGGS